MKIKLTFSQKILEARKRSKSGMMIVLTILAVAAVAGVGFVIVKNKN